MNPIPQDGRQPPQPEPPAPQKDPHPEPDWKRELNEFLKNLNQVVAKASGTPQTERAPTSLKHPLVIAAVITTCVTAGSSLLLHHFQNREAANQRSNELYKSKLDFVGNFGDSFPRSLNALYSNMKELIWLKCYPVSYALDEGLDIKTIAEAEAFRDKQPDKAAKAKDEHRADFDESYKARLQEKKLTAMCAQAMAMFSDEKGEDIRALLKTVRAIQDVADDPPLPEQFQKVRYQTLESKLDLHHNEANELFAKVLETLGNQLAERPK